MKFGILILMLLGISACFRTKNLTEDVSSSDEVTGNYKYYSINRISGGINYELKIRKDKSFEFCSDSHFEGIYTDYGTWMVKKDSIIILTSKVRKIKNSQGVKKEVIKLDRFYIWKENQLCWNSQIEEIVRENCFKKD